MNHNYEIAYVNALTSRLSEDSHDFEIMNKFKGYEGEQLEEDFLKQQHQIVFNHNLEFISSNAVQIDFLIIHNSQISILEVKHYYGDFEIYDNYIKSSYNKRYTSPFVQLYKAKNTLQSIFQEINLNLPIHHYLVFSNPTFTLRNHIPNRSQVLLRSKFYKFPNIRNQNKIVSRPPKNKKSIL
ncbi:NERD domain-containing protein [Mammaliicoccus sciuri]|uniref:nuclease-related domain-containing protein n=1 Tax=Mammaliicoccus sciuri TaxID=1296 RepID=UPI00065B69A7|nr:nuclease-related domain-containing protein [Mammaliicoccus sciuri]MDQ7130182.1 nuclease-related domain-containing protein [Mammaliicoccus sciuri]PNY92736.1 NERD domain-containing protein [Mammaliicoccus sciuri]RIN85153.1 NERD domain-containing protein [Mammaliicoccus sciuri]WRY62258.1 nuclease-related domain-containing protein [Mammaliicoccus sciuri]SQE50775.1 Nuclease-related domain [Mammaliicoccus sciuri]